MIAEETERSSQFFQLENGLRVCYAEYGAEAGTPLIYYHGWPSSRLQAQTLDRIGKERGMTVYALDRPGLGRSDHDKNRKLQDISTVISEFLEHRQVEEKIHLLGVSGGGPYALATACALNERIQTTSVVCGAPPLAEFKGTKGMNPTYRALLKMRPLLPTLIKPALPVTKWVASKTYDEPPLSWFVKTLAPEDRRIFTEDETSLFALDSFREALAQNAPGLILDADAYTLPWELDYETITHPVHFWHGTEDQNLPLYMTEQLASQVPTSIPHWLEGEGHYSVPIKYAEEILECVFSE